jgi:hypothetical protein
VQVDVTEPGQVNHPLWDEPTIANDDDGVWREPFELRPKWLVAFDLVRLRDGNAVP